MSDLSPIQAASVIEATVETVMREHVIPRIEQLVRQHIDGAVYRSIQHMQPNLIREEVRQSVNRLLTDRVEITIAPIGDE